MNEIDNNQVIEQIIEFAQNDADIAAMWLYGSRAKGNHHPGSDFDIAIAYNIVEYGKIIYSEPSPRAYVEEARIYSQFEFQLIEEKRYSNPQYQL